MIKSLFELVISIVKILLCILLLPIGLIVEFITIIMCAHIELDPLVEKILLNIFKNFHKIVSITDPSK